jgi:hypothetical protein
MAICRGHHRPPSVKRILILPSSSPASSPSVEPIIALPESWQVVPILVSQRRGRSWPSSSFQRRGHHRCPSIERIIILPLSSPSSSPSVVVGHGHPRPSNVAVILVLPASSPSSSPSATAIIDLLASSPSSSSHRRAQPLLPASSLSSSSHRSAHHYPPSVVVGRVHPRPSNVAVILVLPASSLSSSHSAAAIIAIQASSVPLSSHR